MWRAFSTKQSHGTVCRRRVLELGSGSIKCQVSEVDVEAQRISKRIATNNATVLFTRDLKIQEDNNQVAAFSSSVQREGMQAMQKMLAQTDVFQPDKTVAVATEAFRRAVNGQQYVSSLTAGFNVPVIIATAKQEAHFGFQTAAAVSGVKKTNLISWDCGAGSFQFSTLSCGSHTDSHGSGTVTALARHLQERGLSPKQVVHAMLETLRHELAPIPATLQEVIQSQKITTVAIGSQHSMFNQQRILSGFDIFSQQDVESSLQESVSLDPRKLPGLELQRSRQYGDADDQDERRCIENATFMVPKLVLLLAVMRHAGMKHATFYKTNGNCEALLTQPWLWE